MEETCTRDYTPEEYPETPENLEARVPSLSCDLISSSLVIRSTRTTKVSSGWETPVQSDPLQTSRQCNLAADQNTRSDKREIGSGE